MQKVFCLEESVSETGGSNFFAKFEKESQSFSRCDIQSS